MCVSLPSVLPVALCVSFVAVRDAETRRAWQQQQANVNAAAEAALQAQLEETTRRSGDYMGESRNAKYACACVKKIPPVRGQNVKISSSLVISSMHLCDFASVSQPPTLLQPRPKKKLLGCGGLASS